MICNGFVDGYTKWVLHGETSSRATENIDTPSDTHESNYTFDMQRVISDAVGYNIGGDECEIENDNLQGEGDEQNSKQKNFTI